MDDRAGEWRRPFARRCATSARGGELARRAGSGAADLARRDTGKTQAPGDGDREEPGLRRETSAKGSSASTRSSAATWNAREIPNRSALDGHRRRSVAALSHRLKPANPGVLQRERASPLSCGLIGGHQDPKRSRCDFLVRRADHRPKDRAGKRTLRGAGCFRGAAPGRTVRGLAVPVDRGTRPHFQRRLCGDAGEDWVRPGRAKRTCGGGPQPLAGGTRGGRGARASWR